MMQRGLARDHCHAHPLPVVRRTPAAPPSIRCRPCLPSHAGAAWTSLRTKASLPERDAGAESAFKQLDKDAKAISSLIKRLRPGEASSETLKTLTSIKARAWGRPMTDDDSWPPAGWCSQCDIMS
jgi:hypothetical protein